MRRKKWTYVCAVGLIAFASVGLFAQGRGHGHGKHDEDEGSQHDFRFSDHDRQAMRHWYSEREENLPPGLAKRDRLPPGLEKQLIERGTLPPGLRKKMHPCPIELVRMLPPPPPECEYTAIGGHIALVNRKTFFVLDIFHSER